MSACTAVLDLGWDDLVYCELTSGHEEPHYTEAWGPQGIAWFGRAA